MHGRKNCSSIVICAMTKTRETPERQKKGDAESGENVERAQEDGGTGEVTVDSVLRTWARVGRDKNGWFGELHCD